MQKPFLFLLLHVQYTVHYLIKCSIERVWRLRIFFVPICFIARFRLPKRHLELPLVMVGPEAQDIRWQNGIFHSVRIIFTKITCDVLYYFAKTIHLKHKLITYTILHAAGRDEAQRNLWPCLLKRWDSCED